VNRVVVLKVSNKIHCIVVLVGDSNSGKTSIIHRYCLLFKKSIVHSRLPNRDIPTVGVEFCSKEIVVDNEKYLLNIWDTCILLLI
jgi:GTPase SAR1 family protein